MSGASVNLQKQRSVRIYFNRLRVIQSVIHRRGPSSGDAMSHRHAPMELATSKAEVIGSLARDVPAFSGTRGRAPCPLSAA
jgi:hypothetical protein